MQLGPDNFGSEVEYGHVWFKVVDKSIHERQKMLQFDACLKQFLIDNKLRHGEASGDGHCFFHCLSQIVFRVDTIEYITALRRLFGDSLPAMETQIFDLAQRNGVMFEQDSRESMQREFKESITQHKRRIVPRSAPRLHTQEVSLGVSSLWPQCCSKQGS